MENYGLIECGAVQPGTDLQPIGKELVYLLP